MSDSTLPTSPALDSVTLSRSASPLPTNGPLTPESRTTVALLQILDEALEWIAHPAIFARDSRKAVLQTIGVIASQRAYTLRTPLETVYAERVPGVREMGERGREWREGEGREGLVEGGNGEED
jgi:hypothetical protein